MNLTPPNPSGCEGFQKVLPEKGALKIVLTLKITFLKRFLAMFMVFRMSYFTVCVQIVVFPILGPLGVVFDLSSGPPSPS